MNKNVIIVFGSKEQVYRSIVKHGHCRQMSSLRKLSNSLMGKVNNNIQGSSKRDNIHVYIRPILDEGKNPSVVTLSVCVYVCVCVCLSVNGLQGTSFDLGS